MSAAADQKKDTRAGNYFISNYPPFSFWSDDQNEQVEEIYNQKPKKGFPRSLSPYSILSEEVSFLLLSRLYRQKRR
jgi:lysophospholipase L1-like esterase